MALTAVQVEPPPGFPESASRESSRLGWCVLSHFGHTSLYKQPQILSPGFALKSWNFREGIRPPNPHD
jgi:hypothetical protein